MGMSNPYERAGRTRQKQRTRDALIAATRELVAEGVTPTVESAAARAEISRTAAYRYFPNQRVLLVAANPEIDRKSLLGVNPPRDAPGRLAAILDEVLRTTVEIEPQLRMALHLSLDPAGGQSESWLRRGRAIAWIEAALSPLLSELSKPEVRRLAIAIR